MKMTDKLRGVVQKVGGAVVMASAYGVGAKAQSQNELDIGQGTIKPIKMLGEDGLESFLKNAINIILIVAGVAAVAYLIYGGLTYITAGGDSERAGKGRTAIMNAIIGVIIIVGALAIYNTVINLSYAGTT